MQNHHSLHCARPNGNHRGMFHPWSDVTVCNLSLQWGSGKNVYFWVYKFDPLMKLTSHCNRFWLKKIYKYVCVNIQIMITLYSKKGKIQVEISVKNKGCIVPRACPICPTALQNDVGKVCFVVGHLYWSHPVYEVLESAYSLCNDSQKTNPVMMTTKAWEQKTAQKPAQMDHYSENSFFWNCFRKREEWRSSQSQWWRGMSWYVELNLKLALLILVLKITKLVIIKGDRMEQCWCLSTWFPCWLWFQLISQSVTGQQHFCGQVPFSMIGEWRCLKCHWALKENFLKLTVKCWWY